MSTIILKNKVYEIVSEVESGVFVVSRKDKKYILRQLENYKDFYYELQTRKKLKKFGINIPKIVKKFKINFCLLIEHISDETMLDVLLKEDISDDAFRELFNIYRFCRFSKIDLDYHPENFAIKNGRMYYLSLSYGEADEKKNLENYGLYFWVYSPQLIAHLKEQNLSIDKKRALSVPEANKKIVLISIMHW